MTAATATDRRRRVWTCSGCEMTVRRADGDLLSEPAGWDSDGNCVQCQRQAIDKEEGQEGVLRWELKRGTGLTKAAKRSGMTMAQSRGIRQGMINRGEIEAPTAATANGNAGKVRAALREKVERKLRKDPDRADSKIAREAGVAPNTVKRARERLGLPEPPTQIESDLKVLRESGPTTAEKFGGRVGVQRARGGRRLKVLVREGLAEMEVVRDGQSAWNVYRATEGAAHPGDHPAEGARPLATPSA